MNKDKILSRFLKYVSFDTQSNEQSDQIPSTTNQLIFANYIYEELKSLGLQNLQTEKGYVYCYLPSNCNKDVPAVGFLAHIDTSPEMSGNNIKPKIIQNYDGNDVILNEELQIKLKIDEHPELKNYVGQTIITTDGTTLLGADDKAGITAIISAVEYILHNPDFKHGDIYITFTPDEEIGRGMDNFDLQKFKANFAYTIDGGALGEIEYENFNAALCEIKIQGNNIHPGYGKNKLINALHIATELNNMLPASERPEHTSGYEGFFHLTKLEGSVEKALMQYLIREHDYNLFEQRKKFITEIVNFLNNKYGQIIQIKIKDQYYNMRKIIENSFQTVQYAIEAMKKENIEPKIVPCRGGTDGSKLSFMGIPCPNIFTGVHNNHSKYEYIPLESIVKATKVILNIINNLAKQ